YHIGAAGIGAVAADPHAYRTAASPSADANSAACLTDVSYDISHCPSIELYGITNWQRVFAAFARPAEFPMRDTGSDPGKPAVSAPVFLINPARCSRYSSVPHPVTAS